MARRTTTGLRIDRRFTQPGVDPYSTIEWSRRDSRITNPDGSVVFAMEDAEIPASWSQVAADIMVSKYFRKAGVPQVDEWGNPVLDADGNPATGPETSARQVFDRLAGTWRRWGEENGYFASAADADVFEDELKYMLANQIASPNSPQWFNTGLHDAYGLTGPAQGFWYIDPGTEEAVPSPDAYSRPAPHACFPAGTRVTTRDGFLPIEKIAPGDEVLTHRGRYGTVTDVMQRQVDEDLVRIEIAKLAASPLIATTNHPVLAVRAEAARTLLSEPHLQVEPEWVPAGELRAADYVVVDVPQRAYEAQILRVGEYVAYRVRGSTKEPFFGTVYNFQVDGDESYIANGVAVHNCFINAVTDDLVNPGGIMDLWLREARLFKYGSGCVAGDARVYVVGEGFVRIRDLFTRMIAAGRAVRDFDGTGRYIDVGDQDIITLSVDPDTGRYQPDKIELLWSYDVDRDDKVTVRFDTGAKATVSAWHPFLAWDGESIVERRADQLSRGDAVLGPNETAVESLSSEPIVVSYETTNYGKHQDHEILIDDDIAWLIGYIMGDGSLGIARTATTNRYGTAYEYQKARLRFNDETDENLTRVRTIIERVFGEKAIAQQDGRGSKGKTLTYGGRKVTGFFSRLFAAGPKTYTMAMPSFVWLGGVDLAISFLAGLVDSDGTVADGRATYTTASHEFAGEVAILASLHRLGGGITRNGNVSTVTVVSKSTTKAHRVRLGSRLAHPIRRERLLADDHPHERKFTMPLSPQLARHLFGERRPSEWLSVEMGHERFHLGRLYYEGLVNPHKVERAVAVMERRDTAVDDIARIARSLAFVTSVEACTDDPDFYDLTVATHSNYLAGESGLVAIHNTGSNFSSIRAENEPLSGGGKSSGVMSFLKIGDRAAGAIKSGGTTRRAAKMVILDLDHPDIETFIDWKKIEEDKARILIQHGGYPADFNGEAYATVSGQNSNNSVRVPNDFVRKVIEDGDWDLVERTTGKVRKTIKARDLWRRIADAAWSCADPGVQFDTIINEWHTSPAGGRIRATNPCSEYVFIDDTACNLASINLVKFLDEETGVVDVDAYRHAIRLWTIVLEISVTMAHFPSEEIAWGSYSYRTLGLGYANLGSLLMRSGIPYDSDAGRAIAGALTAILTGVAYATSAEMAAAVGPFPRFAENREAMLRVIRNHLRAAHGAGQAEYEGLSHHVMGIDPAHTPANLLEAARSSWDLALELGEEHGYRNAQSSCIAPTGTIGLQMDCDTTGVEPDFALVKFKKLAGGGYFKIVNQSVAPALRTLGYNQPQIEDIVRYVIGTSKLEGAPHINRQTLADKGLSEAELDQIDATLGGVFELRHAFNVFVLGEGALQRLGYEVDDYTSFDFDLLRELGFTREQVREATDHICGAQMIEGAPHLLSEHLPVFDTANKNGRQGERYIHHTGHIKMMAAVQPLISGATSKTINLPNEATIEDIEESYMLSWELGVKCMALYRDGSKASQPLSGGSDDGQSEEESDELVAAHQVEKQILWGRIPAGLSPTQAYAQGMHPPRFMLPARRAGWTQEARIGGHKLYLRTGEYDDGTLGELFIDLAKEGATLRGILSCFAIAVSKGLQYGVPLDEFVDTFTFQTFEPRGMIEGHPNIKMANSIVDYVFRALAVEYLHRDELAQVPPQRDGDLPEPPKGMAAEAGLQVELFDHAVERDVDALKKAASFVDSQNAEGPSSDHLASAGPEAQAVRSHQTVVVAAEAGTRAMQSALEDMMGDAPLCDVCGHITIRNGSCYKCLNCGNSLGCS